MACHHHPPPTPHRVTDSIQKRNFVRVNHIVALYPTMIIGWRIIISACACNVSTPPQCLLCWVWIFREGLSRGGAIYHWVKLVIDPTLLVIHNPCWFSHIVSYSSWHVIGLCQALVRLSVCLIEIVCVIVELQARRLIRCC